MSGIDEVSMKVGELQSDARSARRQREKIFEKLDEMSGVIASIPALTERVNDHTQEIKDIKGDVSTFQNLKSKGLGILAGIGLAAGGVSSVVTKLLDKASGP